MNKKQKLIIITGIFILAGTVSAKVISFDVNGKPGLSLISQSVSGVEIEFNMPFLRIEDMDINGEVMQSISVPGVFMLFNKEGAPNVPGLSRYIAIPQGATARAYIVHKETEVIKNIDLIPMHNIPREDDDSPLIYQKDLSIYSKDAYYPENPVLLSNPQKIREVDVVIINITPFQYNPVKKELIVYKKLRVRVDFIGGNGHFGDDRYRSRFWEPLLWGNIINYASLPKIDFSDPSRYRGNGYEYVIITRDDPNFIAWADTIKRWRTLEGIKTGVFTVTQIGGNDVSKIETFIDTAYQNWQIKPVAFLMLGDYPNPILPRWRYLLEYYCYTDLAYSDLNGDTLPDIYSGRIFADNLTHLQVMIGKMLEHERNPPTDPGVYDHPLVACGWQTDRWFQLCAEIVRGFFKNVLGKHPKRAYKIYSGSPYPGCEWSTAPSSYVIVDYFGPNGLGYIPATNPYDYNWWNSGNVDSINNPINQGTFIVLHRDHGSETGWGEPAYYIPNLSALNNIYYPVVFSINCLTGKFTYQSECFLEAFLRYPKRAVGANGATDVSFSFVNDTYLWGYYDALWPIFIPDYPLNDPIPPEPPYRNLKPALAMDYGKYFLNVSNWPNLEIETKRATYKLFHFYGDVFLNMYSEVPKSLNVIHDSFVIPGVEKFTIIADDSSWIALTVNGEIIGEAEGTGGPVTITIPPQFPPDTVIVTVTKYNHFRYMARLPVIPVQGPYIIKGYSIISDPSGNNNGIINPGETIDLSVYAKNVGCAPAYGVYGILTSNSVTILQDSSWFGNIPAGDSALGSPVYKFQVPSNAQNNQYLAFSLISHDSNDTTWISNFFLEVYKPVISKKRVYVTNDENGNGLLEPNEQGDLIVVIKNTGGDATAGVNAKLVSLSPLIEVIDSTSNYGAIQPGDSANNLSDPFKIFADPSTPGHYQANFLFITQTEYDIDTFNITITVGKKHYFLWDPDPNHSSGPVIHSLLQQLGYSGDYSTTLSNFSENLYMALFVCVGIYPNNYRILANSQEALTIVNFAQNSGGRVYLEGGDVWYWDPFYAGGHNFGPLFGINPISDGIGNLAPVQGIDGTFTEGMYFTTYSGENNNIDHIQASGGGSFNILYDANNNYYCGVANNAGTYKTVGTSFEIAGLEDGTTPSTRLALLDSIMHFFEIHPVGQEERNGISLGTPRITKLIGAIPNPSFKNTEIVFQIAKKERVNLIIYDATGRISQKLIEGKVLDPGKYRIKWNKEKIPKGVYFIKLETESYRGIKKCVVLR